jgi:hypothetical protein
LEHKLKNLSTSWIWFAPLVQSKDGRSP